MNRKIIENWLINANELAFTIPFCQILAAKKLVVLRAASKKSTLEQGKDVIALDASGIPHCYQLKAGVMTLKRFEREVIPELNSLLNIKPVHPSIKEDKATKWRSYLVLNCDMRGEATQGIEDFKRTKLGELGKNLSVITRNELIADFEKYYGDFFPEELSDFERFLEMYNAPADDIVDKRSLTMFYESYFSQLFNTPVDVKSLSMNAKRQLLNAGLVITSYMLGKKYKSANHHAIIQTWLICLQYILAAAEKDGKLFKIINPLVDLVFDEIRHTNIALGRELMDEGLLSPSGSLEESIIFQRRFTDIVCLHSSLTLATISESRTTGSDSEVLNPEKFMKWVLERNEHIKIDGEGDIPGFVAFIIMLAVSGYQADAVEVLKTLVDSVVGSASNPGLPSPYYDYETIIKNRVGLRLSDRFNETFQGASYSLKPLIMVAAYLEQKNTIEPL